ncbi:MAG: hypothetical protein CL676_13545 [Bdellovibrionaceae bacterium]|nr:hypothetical protein [Pseudobdellovibrionaceae bacterium]|tara:strand:- start:300 stop:620 length:321 start_codon:yes stop_codon:yes gene_type:complete
MQMERVYTVSVSLKASDKSPDQGREAGKNLTLIFCFRMPPTRQEEANLSKIVAQIDHTHLSSNPKFGLRNYRELLPWIQNAMGKDGAGVSEIRLDVDAKTSYRLRI